MNGVKKDEATFAVARWFRRNDGSFTQFLRSLSWSLLFRRRLGFHPVPVMRSLVDDPAADAAAGGRGAADDPS